MTAIGPRQIHWKKAFIPALVGAATLALLLAWEKDERMDPSHRGQKIPVVNGHRETCLVCHKGVHGFSPAHDPQAIGCSACHLGNPQSLDKQQAHRNMVKIPGNLNHASITCGQSQCHQDISSRIHDSLMATGRGMVSVNRYVFAEKNSPDDLAAHLSRLTESPADQHLRRLCSSCHLDNEKVEYAPISQKSRGGGCTACHLQYTKESATELDTFLKDKSKLPKSHPKLSIAIRNDSCFGCHSRSGRIATNYEGWHETGLTPDDVKGKKGYRILDDERVFTKKEEDVHHKAGMQCIDCHTSRETMGDGKRHFHQDQQTEVRCTDCHFPATDPKANKGQWQDLDSEQQKIWELHKLTHKQNFLRIAKTGKALINAFARGDGSRFLQGKLDKKIRPMKNAAPVCDRQIQGHERLSCQSCHTSWAPHCISCHTQWDSKEEGYDHLRKKFIKGAWVEYAGPFLADPPTLGVRRIVEHGKSVEKIEPFIPGMVLTINTKDAVKGKETNEHTVFRRMYAPTSPHTISKKGRSCESCHQDPLALGFGRGKLSFTKTGKQRGEWRFQPRYKSYIDGLPEDAWTHFLEDRTHETATRSDSRPFQRKEQEKILTVGACLSCHPGTPANNQKIYKEFSKSLTKMTPACVLPEYR